MRALVIGSDGFIGRHLCRVLGEQGHWCDAWDLPVFDAVRDNTWSWQEWDVVFLLAAKLGVSAVEAAPYETLDVNVRIVQNVLRWLPNKGERLVFASSSEVVSGSVSKGLAPVPTPEDVPVVCDPDLRRHTYALSKVVGESLVRYGHSNWTVCRFHNVYGPGQTRGVIRELWDRRSHNPFYLPGANHTRAFCYIDDAVEATVRLAACGEAAGQVVNVGTPEEVTIAELAKRFLGPGTYFPRPAPSGSPKRRCPDITRLTLLTGWRPTVMLDEGLERTRQWLKSTTS